MRYKLQATLEAHQSWVRDLQWCRNSPFFQLVSVGDRIALWDLNSARVDPSNVGIPSLPNRNNPLAGGMGFPLTPITPGSSSSSNSSSRFANASQSFGLVQTVEFQTRGRYASKLFVSDDGRSLVTVSDSGILYILHQLGHHWNTTAQKLFQKKSLRFSRNRLLSQFALIRWIRFLPLFHSFQNHRMALRQQRVYTNEERERAKKKTYKNVWCKWN